MNNDQMKERILNFLNANQLGVISTIHADRQAPESAVVGFGNNQELELIFGTATSTRKYRNLQENSNVSFVIGWSSTTGSLQYEGVAQELSRTEAAEFIPLLIEKNKYYEQFLKRPDQRHFLVKPTWIRFQDNAANPPETYEITF